MNQKIRSEGDRHVASCEEVVIGVESIGAKSDFSRATECDGAVAAQDERAVVVGDSQHAVYG